MEYKIISPKTVYLIGDPNLFEEKQDRNDENKELDYYHESVIEYQDLVFTLRHDAGKCFRPYLRFESGELKVVGNNIYFRAAKEAGIKKLKFDLLLDKKLPLEALLERYSLEFSPPAIQREYMQRFLFFKNPLRNINEENPLIIMSSLNSSEEFRKSHCITYKILIENPETVASLEHELVARLFNEYGYLRSIDGDKNKCWILGNYIY